MARKYWPFGRSASCTSGIYLNTAWAMKLVGMSRPPVQTNFGKAAGTLLLLLGLAVLVGCQGVSAGGSGQTQTGALNFGSATLDFGSVAAGTSKTLTVTATNSEAQSVTISSAAITTQYFSLTAPSLPVTIAAGQSVTISVKFTPNAVGSFSATASVTSDASNAVANIGLTGTGTAGGQLALNPASELFGNVTVGTKQSQSVTLTNNGGASVNISAAAVSGTGFQLTRINNHLTLTASQSTTRAVAFESRALGSASGTVMITSDGSNPTLTMGLTGTGVAAGALGPNPASLDFGSVLVGNNQTLSETVTNTGGSSLTISQVAASGTGFSLSGITAPVTLTVGQSATFSVAFAPTTAGAVSGNVTITSNGSNPTLTIPLAGIGTAAGSLGANPSSLGFGSVLVGSNKALSETLTNTGSTSITISQVATSGTGFSLSGITAPVTLTTGQTATFSVTFAPTTAGAVSGNVTITSTASNPTLTIPLTGTGTTAGALGANPTSLSFGSVLVGSNKTLSETVTNTGGTSVTISQVAASGTGFSLSGITAPVTLTAGQSATFSVAFAPTTAGAASGNVTITSNGSNPTLTIPLTGTGTTAGALGANPTSLSFGSVVVGNKGTLSETVTNTGGTSVTISQVAISGSDFTLSGITAPVTLTGGQSATFSVVFTPVSTSTVSGTVTITSNGSNPTLTIPLSGTGTAAAGQLTVAPTTLGLGTVAVGSSGSASGTLTASGASVTVTAASSSNSVFSVGGLSLPVTIPAGSSTSFTVTFSPLTTGAVSATLTFTSNAQPTTTTETVTGTGTAASTHTVNLSWSASTSSNISGYNVYRALYVNSLCGSFSKINSSLNTGTLYTDSGVINSTSYCYATTAVDSTNEESGYSNIVSNIQIPVS